MSDLKVEAILKLVDEFTKPAKGIVKSGTNMKKQLGAGWKNINKGATDTTRNLKKQFGKAWKDVVVRSRWARREIKKEFKHINENAKKFGKHLNKAGGYGLRAGAGLLGLSFLFERTFVGTAKEFEQYEAILKTVEGSRDKARASLQWASDFAATTPFQLGQVTEAFVQLRNYGLDPTNGLLKTLGDTSAGMGKDIMQAVEAIADAVTGENERLKEFGIKARAEGDFFIYEYSDSEGRTQFLKALKSDRVAIQKTLRSIMDEKFAGAMEEQAKTFTGLLSMISDNFTRTMNNVMDKGGVLVWMKQQLGDFIGELQKVADNEKLAAEAGREIKEVLSTLLAMLKGVWQIIKLVISVMKPVADLLGGWNRLFAILLALPIASSLLGLISTIASLIVSLKALGIAFTIGFWPITLAVVAIGSLGYALYQLYKNWGTVWSGMKDVVMSVFKFMLNNSPIGLMLKGIGLFSKALKSLFNGDETTLKVANANAGVTNTTPLTRRNRLARTPIATTRSNSTQQIVYEGSNIQVHAAPGMNEEQVAELVVKKQAQAQRSSTRRARARQHDGVS